jgi:hypothetical protein
LPVSTIARKQGYVKDRVHNDLGSGSATRAAFFVQMGGYYNAFEKRKIDLAEFADTFASFTADTPSGASCSMGAGPWMPRPASSV